jgi:hypothetical protein
MNSLPTDKRDFKKDDIQFELTAMNFIANEAINNGMEDIGKPISDKVNAFASMMPR